MSEFIHYPVPHGFVHDLVHWQAIDPDECCLLLLSARSLYLLQNLVAFDALFSKRYAVELRADGYYTPLELEAGWQTYLDATTLLQAEVIDMACDISALLQDISDALTAIQETNVQINITNRMAAAATQDSSLCCSPAGDRPYSEELPGETENPLTSIFCDRAWSLARNWADASSDLIGHWIAGEVAGAGVIAIIAAALEVPLSIILGIVAVIATVILEVTKDDYTSFANSLVPDIACAIYSATNPEAAKAAVNAVIDGAEKPSGWAALATPVLKQLLTQDAINDVFDESYTVRSDSEGSDCWSCVEGVLLQTANAVPLDVLQIGDAIENFTSEGENFGWSIENPGQFIASFTPEVGVTIVNVAFEVFGLDVVGDWHVTPSLRTYPGGSTVWAGVQHDYSDDDEWHSYVELDLDVTLTQGVTYALYATQNQFGKTMDIRSIRIWAD